MAFDDLYCLITMEKSSANKNQPPSQFLAFIHVLLFHKFLTWIKGVTNFFLRFWSVFQSQLESAKSGNWDEKSQNFEFCNKQRQSSFSQKKEDGSICREEAEMVMERLTLFCSPEGEELPRRLDSSELSRLFDEKEPSLEEVKETFDVFDQNKDGFIDAMELQRVLLILGMKEGLELENCTKMIKTFDENGDGKIDFKEFVKFMQNRFIES